MVRICGPHSLRGPRPARLFRRGAVYSIRFRIPVDLVPRLGLMEFRRSLDAPDPKCARERCGKATIWFHNLIDHCRMSDEIDRHEFERRAQRYFEGLKEDIERPSPTGERAVHFDADEQSEASESRLSQLTFQLQTYDFDRSVKVRLPPR